MITAFVLFLLCCAPHLVLGFPTRLFPVGLEGEIDCTSHCFHAGRAKGRRPVRALPILGRGVSPYAPTLGLRQRRGPFRAGSRTSAGGRRAAGILGRGVRLTRHRTAAASRDCFPAPTRATALYVRVAPGSPAGGTPVTRLVPGI